MGIRGRPSMAALMMPGDPIETIQRPDAPYELTDEEADEWRAVVGTMPAGHFMRTNFALLSQYCRHVIAARRVAQLIGQVLEEREFNRKEFGALLQLQVTETAAIIRLLRSMRLTQQSVLRAETKHPRGPARRPWDPERAELCPTNADWSLKSQCTTADAMRA